MNEHGSLRLLFMRKLLILVLAVWGGVTVAGGASGGKARHVVIIVWDGMRPDFINAENSMGFHAPQESARILAEAIDYARQGQVKALGSSGGTK